MGFSRVRNSTRPAQKTRSVKPTPKRRRKRTRSPAAVKKRLAKRKRYTGRPSPTEVLRETRGDTRIRGVGSLAKLFWGQVD